MIKLVDEFNHNFHLSIWKKPINTDYSALSEEVESSHKSPKFKDGDRVRVIKYKNIFSEGYTNYLSKEIISLILC